MLSLQDVPDQTHNHFYKAIKTSLTVTLNFLAALYAIISDYSLLGPFLQ